MTQSSFLVNYPSMIRLVCPLFKVLVAGHSKIVPHVLCMALATVL